MQKKVAASPGITTMFQFKQFAVNDDLATMKVNTDAVLLGVLASAKGNVHRILDVGTGCGVIALMMAQRFTEASVEAIDIDAATVSVAAGNFTLSPWPERLKARCISLQKLAEDAPTPESDNEMGFDLIVSNPPYFTNSLRNDDPRKRMARHDDRLSLEALFEGAHRLLKPGGSLSLIVPAKQESLLQKLSSLYNMTVRSTTTIHNRATDPAKRIVCSFVKPSLPTANTTHLGVMNGSNPMQSSEPPSRLVMRNDDNSYSAGYRQLTQNYYLWLHE